MTNISNVEKVSTHEEMLLAADILRRLPEGQPLLRILFTEIARLVTTPVIEFIPLKVIDGKVNVLTIPREVDDPLWPSMMHSPGSTFRPSDNTFEKVFTRLLNGELDDIEVLSATYAGIELHYTKRGNELAHIFYGEIGDVSVGTYYPVDALPNSMIDSQLGMIAAVASEYAQAKNIPLPELPYTKANLIKLIPSNAAK